MSYAAIEVKEDETPHEVVEMLMKLAVERSTPFKALEVFGVMTVGVLALVRFRTDCSIDTVQHLKDRAYIIPTTAGFRIYDGLDEGKVDTFTMTQPYLAGQRRLYRGPAQKFWERQFIFNAKKV